MQVTCETLNTVADSDCPLDPAGCKARCESTPLGVRDRFCQRVGQTLAIGQNPMVHTRRLCGRATARWGVLSTSSASPSDADAALIAAIRWCDASCLAGVTSDCEGLAENVKLACANRDSCKTLCDLDDIRRPSSKQACAQLIGQ